MTGFAECPGCMGEGCHDFADGDALLEEILEPAVLAYAKAEAEAIGRKWGGSVVCSECEGTRLVTADRARDMQAAAAAVVDQIIARVRDNERAAS